MTAHLTPPWDAATVAALNDWQAGPGHPFTCGEDHGQPVALIATADGWRCPRPECAYRQAWAHDFMADPAALATIRRQLDEWRNA